MTQHIEIFKLSARLLAATTVFGLASGLSACQNVTSAVSPGVALSIEVRAASDAPDNYGLVPGDSIVGALVEVRSKASSDGPQYSAMTDNSGRVVLKLESGSYYVNARKDTHDPKCWWAEGAEVQVVDAPVTVALHKLWVVCE